MKIHFDLELNDGELILKGRKRVLEELKMTGKTHFMGVLEAKKRKRSVVQNRYYWGVMVPMVRDGLLNMGYALSSEETHEFLKAKFNEKSIVNEDTGEILSFPGSTTEMSTTDFMAYKESVQQFGSDYLGIYIPDPNEQIEIDV